jgi:nucleoside-diphosphate-sugar epimerase
MNATNVLIIGCGDIGRRLATAFLTDGALVTGIVNSRSSADALRGLGITPWVSDLDSSAFTVPDGPFDVIYHMAPPPGDGTVDTRTTRLLNRLPPWPRIVYLSTTGVYGDRNGAWTDESVVPEPTSARGRRRLDAETQVTAWSDMNGVEHVILRVAAIYGPGRLPLGRLHAGAVAIRPDEAAPTNRIHANDLTTICMAAAANVSTGAIYDCADGTPTSSAEFLSALADLTGLPRPRLVSAHEADGVLPVTALDFLRESKRIRARRVREELGVELEFPDFRDGLRASLDA